MQSSSKVHHRFIFSLRRNSLSYIGTLLSIIMSAGRLEWKINQSLICFWTCLAVSAGEIGRESWIVGFELSADDVFRPLSCVCGVGRVNVWVWVFAEECGGPVLRNLAISVRLDRSLLALSSSAVSQRLLQP